MKRVLAFFMALTFAFSFIQSVPANAARRVAVTSVKLSASSMKLTVGQSSTYKATIAPSNATNKAVSWKSSNTKVATVDTTGKVKAIAIGSATITCTSKDNTSQKATCSLTVGKKVASIKLSSNNLRLGLGKTFKITATVSPVDAINKSVSWSSANTKVATVDSTGTVKAVASGTTIITCAAKDGSGVKISCAVAVGNSTLGGILSYMFNSKDGYFYTESDPWQRQFGFNYLYDWGAPLFVMYYSTVRFKFNYKGLDWMIQSWKGQYGFAFIGSEIGVYTKPEDRTSEHYDSASNENALKIEMTCYKGDTKLFTRPYDTYWWSTGFVTGSLTRYADRSELTVVARITLKDTEMKDAFVEAIQGSGFTYGSVVNRLTVDTYTVRGNDVYFNWKNIEQ